MSKSTNNESVNNSKTCRAPRVKSWVPFIGSGIAFNRDPDGFFLNAQKNYGDYFTAQLGPLTVTFLMNPLDYAEFFKSSHSLDFDKLGQDVAKKAFGMNIELLQVDDLGKKITEGFQHKYLRGDYLEPLTSRMQETLISSIMSNTKDQWEEGDFFDFVARLVFEAGSEALFGEGTYSEELYESYSVLDKNFMLLSGGVPATLLPGMTKHRNRLYDLMEKASKNPRASDLTTRLQDYLHSIGFDKDEHKKINTGFLWVSQANTVIIAFYTLFYILRDPEVRQIILKEIDEVFPGSENKDANNSINFDFEKLDKLVKLDSCINETLRLNTSAMPIRDVIEKITIPLSCGDTLLLEPGDIVAIYPRSAHTNPDIYSDPEKFQWDRFLNKLGPNKFHYKGKPLKYNLIPFGGGKNMCPGRHFARNEFLIITAVLLRCFDIELLDTVLPPLNMRTGGALGPTHDVRFKYKRKI